MTIDLKRELTNLAARSVNYADAQAAIRTARRRRRHRMIAAPVLAAVTGIAVAAGLIAVGPRHAARPPVTPAPFALPATISVPPHVALLPPSGPVGRAVAAYRQCPGTCPTYLVMGDGRQYRVDVPVTPGHPDWVQISPDGRWLAVPTGRRTETIRDLLGTAVLPTTLEAITGWSADDRLVMGGNSDGRFVMVAATGGVVNTAGPSTIAITDAGQLIDVDQGVVVRAYDPAPDLYLQWMPPYESHEVQALPLLHADEGVLMSASQTILDDGTIGSVTWGAATSPGGRLAVSAYDSHPHGTRPNVWWTRTAVLVGDLGKATVDRRIDLPPNSGRPFFYQEQITYPTQRGPGAPIVIRTETANGFVDATHLPAKAEYIIAGMPQPTVGPAYLPPGQ